VCVWGGWKGAKERWEIKGSVGRGHYGFMHNVEMSVRWDFPGRDVLTFPRMWE